MPPLTNTARHKPPMEMRKFPLLVQIKLLQVPSSTLHILLPPFFSKFRPPLLLPCCSSCCCCCRANSPFGQSKQAKREGRGAPSKEPTAAFPLPKLQREQPPNKIIIHPPSAAERGPRTATAQGADGRLFFVSFGVAAEL
jgi:hypothetical protein